MSDPDLDLRVLAARIEHLRELNEERFASVAQRFTERDQRLDQAAANFAKQIGDHDCDASRAHTAFNVRLTELKERIDRGEGNVSGQAAKEANQRAVISQVIAVIAVLTSIAAVIILVVKK